MNSASKGIDQPAERSGHEPDARDVLRQFRVVYSAVRAHFADIERMTGHGGAQVWALSVVAQQPGMGVTELAMALDVHQSTASNLVRGLVKKGLLVSEKSVTDRRSVLLRVTDEGLALLASAPGPHRGVLPQALDRLEAGTVADLHRCLADLIGLMEGTIDKKAAHQPLANL